MSFDGLMLHSVKKELTDLLSGARLAKIYQPQKKQVIFHLHQKGQSYKLLFSATATEARVHLVSRTPPNPARPPLFCMVLRKHLEGARLLTLHQPGLERLLEIKWQVLDQLGETSSRKLILEIMGKHSNLILVDQENKIIDALQRIPPTLSRYRQVLPGLTYQSPPAQDKIIPWQAEPQVFYEHLFRLPLNTKLAQALLMSCQGLSPQSIQEIIYRATLAPDLQLEYCGEYELSRLWQVLHDLPQSLSPELIFPHEQAGAFSAFPLTAYPVAKRHRFKTMNEALDHFFAQQEERKCQRQLAQQLNQVITREIARQEKRKGFQKKARLKAQNADRYRLWGELLTANLYQLTPGKEVQVSNYYEPPGQIETIPLKAELSISANAQHYFQQYQKCKKTLVQTAKQLAIITTELTYLQSLAQSLEQVSELKEMLEIKEEMQAAGYLKKLSRPSPKEEPSALAHITLDNWLIYWGKNHRQNDYLTMKIAKKDDLWLHPQKMPGAHVVIKNPQKKEIPMNILNQAALIAAYHSPGRHSSKVPIDYTARHNVWKPQGAKPGFVLYEQQKTLYVTPDSTPLRELGIIK